MHFPYTTVRRRWRAGSAAISAALLLLVSSEVGSAAAQTAGPTTPTPQSADAPPPVAREFRAAWVASVGNIDWPSRPDLSTWQQQQELLTILNRAVDLRLNAVILQVRPGSDALYKSAYEPWSEFLTGRQGRAPDPMWDPLEFAVEAAHERGLELHAWFNPYRARYASPTGEPARTHVSQTNPELVREYGSFQWTDPGDPAARERAVRVILDVVRRYDIDGVHIDDYFYPYREPARNGGYIRFPDDATYARYVKNGGTLARDDWRRRNVDLLVEELYRTIKATKRWVKFGVSPFGIWRPDYPAGMTGLDSYQEIFADSRKWLRNGWLDYFVPQLYWAIDSPQSYPVLLRWWSEQNVKGRHLWPGNGLHRVTPPEARGRGWPAEEIVNQVRLTRAQPGASGNVFFSMRALITDVDSIGEKLAPLYAEPALIPASPWLGESAPATPTISVRPDSITGEPILHVTPAAGGTRAWLWVVQTHTGAGWLTEILPATQVSHRLRATHADLVSVFGVSRTGITSAAAERRW